MRNKNERVELEMQIMRFRLLGKQVTDEQFVQRSQLKIAELEKKLREIDE